MIEGRNLALLMGVQRGIVWLMLGWLALYKLTGHQFPWFVTAGTLVIGATLVVAVTELSLRAVRRSEATLQQELAALRVPQAPVPPGP